VPPGAEDSRTAYAHSVSGRPESEWEPLECHLEEVATRAEGFASRLGYREWGRIAGLWHDLGKYSTAFQDYLRGTAQPGAAAPSRGSVDHATAGAQHAVARVELLGHLLAYVIAGHHSGLLDAIGEGASLENRLRKAVEEWGSAPRHILEAASGLPVPEVLRKALGSRPPDPFRVAFAVRMLFSCLVDADFLATEGFLDRSRASGRPNWPGDLLKRMESELERFVERFGPARTTVDLERSRVRMAALTSAAREPGFFSLTVPTGGGKTLAALAFALRHAREHGSLDRVLYVAPFTTIIEQNAEVFRSVFRDLTAEVGADLVVEHHGSVDLEEESREARLATENWDAPLIVTTSVQFYESLFASRVSKCRKLHRIARSVVILDEVQALPVHVLTPCLRALRELVEVYGCTVVLCTATQPALGRRAEFPVGLEAVREIVPEPRALYESLRRVSIEFLGRTPDSALAARLLAEKQALCVVNTRAHARALFAELGEGAEHFHLSAWMCPAHRSEMIARIRSRLESDEPCRVISTQLVEAGVDLDFPLVMRALAGIDSIAQAAGRCNRNGRLPELGVTLVFESEHREAERYFADTADCARQVVALHADLLGLDAVERYFRLYYWSHRERWDEKRVLEEFRLDRRPEMPFLFNYASAADRFRLIDDAGQPVVVPWGDEGRQLSRELRRPGAVADWRILRRLQRFTVQVPSRTWRQQAGSSFTIEQERFAVLLENPTLYSESLGLRLDGSPGEAYIV